MSDKRAIELLTEIRDLLKLLVEPQAHDCYRCGRKTIATTAWCADCLRKAEEHRQIYPPGPKPRLPRLRRAAN